jgi:hypothetical protein
MWLNDKTMKGALKPSAGPTMDTNNLFVTDSAKSSSRKPGSSGLSKIFFNGFRREAGAEFSSANAPAGPDLCGWEPTTGCLS